MKEILHFLLSYSLVPGILVNLSPMEIFNWGLQCHHHWSQYWTHAFHNFSSFQESTIVPVFRTALTSGLFTCSSDSVSVSSWNWHDPILSINQIFKVFSAGSFSNIPIVQSLCQAQGNIDVLILFQALAAAEMTILILLICLRFLDFCSLQQAFS